jgi:phage terminase large subunit
MARSGTKTVSTGYVPRPIQALLHAKTALFRFIILVCHRRFGKTIFVINEMIDRSLRNELKSPQYAYIAPTYGQAKRIAWEYLKSYTKNLPNVNVNESELKVTLERPHLQDKITYYLLGADNPDSLAGIYLDGVLLDEYSLMNPAVWKLIIRPALSDRKGWAIFIGTPRGQNHFYDVFKFAQDEKNGWFAALYKASETGIIDAEEIESMKSEMSDEEFAQEMECSFTAALMGSYYGKYIEELEKSKRILPISYDLHVPVETAWDLGIGDTTAIWFFQRCGTEVHVIDYYEMSGVGLEHYVKHLKSKPYIYHEHHLPHDANARSLETGNTRIETLKKFGLGKVHLLPRIGVEDGIHAVRMILPRCYFDVEKCDRGLSALKNYQKKWDSKAKIYIDKPLHDWSSNGADAFRYLALSIRPNRNIINHSSLAKTVYENYNILG